MLAYRKEAPVPARNRRDESPLIEEVFVILRAVPVWVGPILALLVYAVCRWAFPGLLTLLASGEDAPSDMGRSVLSGLSITLAPFITVIVVGIWVAAVISKFTDRRRFERVSGADSLDRLDWRTFETLLAEAFRRQGFVVEHSGKAGPDGGIDLRLNKAGAVTLVQCKHWKTARVGVRVVRELLGVVSSERAQSGIVVTSGKFTPDAVAFAERTPIRLIEGEELIGMLGDAQKSGRIHANAGESRSRAGKPDHGVSTPSDSDPECPRCGAAMVRRLARKGPHAGSQFLGCSRYPECKSIRGMDHTRT